MSTGDDSSGAPDSKCTAEGSNARACAFRTLHEHAIGAEDILLLAICLGLEVSDAACEEVGIHNFALAPAELQFLFKLLLLESEPLSDLSPAEGDLTSTVADIKTKGGCLDWTSRATLSAPQPGAGMERPALSLQRQLVQIIGEA